MTLGRLARRHAVSHPVRVLLTVGAVMVAMFLFCFLRSIVTSLDAAVEQSASNRVVTGSAVSLFQSLPRSYKNTIEEMESVESVCLFTWFGGLYQGPEGFFGQFGTDPQTLLEQYPEVLVPPEQTQAWFDDKQGAIIGVALAEKYGWQVGDQVPLIGTIYPRNDGAEWTFNIRGIYRSTKANVDEMTMYFHWTYLDEVLERGDAEGPRGTSVYIVKIAEGHSPQEVIDQIDLRYQNGPQRTRTQTEAAFQAGFVSMLGNLPTFLGMIGGAVLFAIMFGVINTMTIAARERTRSMGVMRALGFSRRIPARLYIMEATGIVLLGGSLGVGIALWTQPVFRKLFGTQIPVFHVATNTVVWAGIICIVIGLLAGAVPAWRTSRLKAVDALRRGA